MLRAKKCLLVLLMTAVAGCAASADQVATAPSPADRYKVARVMKISGDGRWDYVTIDPVAGLLYVPRQTHVQVIRAETGEVIDDLKDTDGVHGVALASDAGPGFTSNGRASTVTVFDINSRKVIATLPTGEGPDAIVYDPFSKKVFVFDGKGQDATVIDAAAPTETPPAHIPVGGKPEFSVADGRGNVYVNIEDTSEVARIDTRTMKVADRWKLEGGAEPTGLAIDPAHNRLFVGCGNRVMVILDAGTGKSLGTVPIGKGVDACAFDASTGEAFASCGDGTLTVVKETSPGHFSATQTVQTRPGARTMVLDPVHHTIYLPTSDFLPPAQGETRPQMKPETFMILVVKAE